MPARPIETFQSEGWKGTMKSRRDHYYRLDRADQSGAPLKSHCGRFALGEGHRPHLKYNTTRACAKCLAIETAELLS